MKVGTQLFPFSLFIRPQSSILQMVLPNAKSRKIPSKTHWEVIPLKLVTKISHHTMRTLSNTLLMETTFIV